MGAAEWIRPCTHVGGGSLVQRDESALGKGVEWNDLSRFEVRGCFNFEFGSPHCKCLKVGLEEILPRGKVVAHTSY